jgi:hypothetical protein
MSVRIKMDSVLEQMVIDLYIIGSLKAHQRLATQQGAIRIELIPESWWGHVSWPLHVCRRIWYGESRQKSLEHVRTIMHRALHVLQSWGPDVPWPKHMLLHAMQRAHDGLVEMKQTYADDAGMVAALDVLIAATAVALKAHEE